MSQPCDGCGFELEDSALSCLSCGRLTRSSELTALADEAKAAAAAGNLTVERGLWRQALALLPPGTVQYRSIETHLAELDAKLEAAGSGKPAWWRKLTSALAPGAMLLWKFKALLFGLTKLSTLFSMFAFFGVYWALYGWGFALGLVLSIYVHEMGHVLALRGYGLPASAPMFIPGFGAFIRLRTLRITPVQDARIGLAGPIYGLGTALFCLAAYALTGKEIFGVVANFGAVINLFNLIPVWQLDGSRGFRSLTRQQRMVVLACAVGLFFAVRQPMLLLIAAGATWRLFTNDAAGEDDSVCLMQYAGLLVALSAVLVFSPLK